MNYLYLCIPIFILAFPAFSAGYSDKLGIQVGDIVDLDYIGTFQNGTEFDSGNIPNARMELGQFIDGFFEGVLGMIKGETKSIVVPPEKGYTQPKHLFYGIILVFTVTINAIVENIRGDETSTTNSTDTSILSTGSVVTSNQTTVSSTSQSSTSTPRLELPVYLGEVYFSLSILIITKQINLSRIYRKEK